MNQDNHQEVPLDLLSMVDRQLKRNNVVLDKETLHQKVKSYYQTQKAEKNEGGLLGNIAHYLGQGANNIHRALEWTANPLAAYLCYAGALNPHGALLVPATLEAVNLVKTLPTMLKNAYYKVRESSTTISSALYTTAEQLFNMSAYYLGRAATTFFGYGFANIHAPLTGNGALRYITDAPLGTFASEAVKGEVFDKYFVETAKTFNQKYELAGKISDYIINSPHAQAASTFGSTYHQAA